MLLIVQVICMLTMHISTGQGCCIQSEHFIHTWKVALAVLFLISYELGAILRYVIFQASRFEIIPRIQCQIAHLTGLWPYCAHLWPRYQKTRCPRLSLLQELVPFFSILNFKCVYHFHRFSDCLYPTACVECKLLVLLVCSHSLAIWEVNRSIVYILHLENKLLERFVWFFAFGHILCVLGRCGRIRKRLQSRPASVVNFAPLFCTIDILSLWWIFLHVILLLTIIIWHKRERFKGHEIALLWISSTRRISRLVLSTFLICFCTMALSHQTEMLDFWYRMVFSPFNKGPLGLTFS